MSSIIEQVSSKEHLQFTLGHDRRRPSCNRSQRHSGGHAIASHLVDTLADPPADVQPALEDMRTFADEHILHWFEGLSAFDELESDLKSLATAVEAISVSVQCRELVQLTDSVEVLLNI